MKLTKDLQNGMVVELESENVKNMFGLVSQVQEVFQQECGKCGNKQVIYCIRKVSGDEYYELRCSDSKCRAKIAFGQAKDNVTVYPKRQDSEGNWKGANGWTIWNSDTKQEE